LLPPGLPGREPTNHIPPANPILARSLLAEAGHPGGKGLTPLRIGITPGPTTVRMTEMIERDLEAVGFDVCVERYNWRELETLTLSGRLPAFLMSWVADLPDPDAFLYPLFHSEGNSNMFAYRSDVTDSLLARGRALAPSPERNRIYNDLQNVILGDAPLIPLYHNSLAYAWNKDLQGIEIGACGFALVPFRRVYRVPAGDVAQGGRP
jgi:ABC-type transport system substrate-binding protein